MKKKLVFYLYLNWENITSEVYKIHFACLSYYIDVFDEILFVISLDDTTDYKLIHEALSLLSKIDKKGNVGFKIWKNDVFQEASAFKDNVADKLNENELVFFCHGKGVSNSKSNQEIIQNWILGMYFYNLNFITEVHEYLQKEQFLSYGSFLTKVDNTESKYKWYYSGSFFWINCPSLVNYMAKNETKIPALDNRYYAENFLGNIFPSWPKFLASSHNLAYYEGENINFYNTDSVSTFYLTYDDFNNFKQDILKRIKK